MDGEAYAKERALRAARRAMEQLRRGAQAADPATQVTIEPGSARTGANAGAAVGPEEDERRR